jgi:N-acetyl-gamma-glutamyl-phosphate reductase
VTGAGRVAKLETHFVEAGGDLAPYKVGEVHQHRGEMEETIARHAKVSALSLIFNPVLVPTARGILSMISIPLQGDVSQDDVQNMYSECYGDAAFVRVLTDGKLPHTRNVRGSNRCDLAVRLVDGGKLLQVYSVIDNLLKGAAGQAVQNWNVSEGWPEDLGLSRDAWTFV